MKLALDVVDGGGELTYSSATRLAEALLATAEGAAAAPKAGAG